MLIPNYINNIPIQQWFDENYSILMNDEIKKITGLSLHQISYLRSKFKLFKSEEIFSRSRSHKKYQVNHDSFKVIDYNISYILGFIAADGCVSNAKNSLLFNIQKQDIEILRYINLILESNHPIKSYNNHSCCLGIASIQIKKDLNKIGLTLPKNLILSFQSIPDRYFWSWLRGLFDGDGCFSISKNNKRFRIYSNDTAFLRTILNRIGTSGGIYKSGKVCHALEINRKNDLLFIYDKLYNNHCDFCLKRKQCKFYTAISH